MQHRVALDFLVTQALAELNRRESSGSNCRRIRVLGLAFEVRFTSWERLLLIDRASGATVSSRYGVVR